MRRNLLLLATTIALLAGPAIAQTNKVITLDTSKSFVSNSEGEQRFSDSIDLQPGQETLPLKLNVSNGDSGHPGFKWLRISIAGRPFLTEKDFKGQTMSVDVSGDLGSGGNQIYIVGGGVRGATVSWNLTTPPVTITSTTPSGEVSVGDSLQVRGTNVSSNTRDLSVAFKDGKLGEITQVSGNQITVTVPNDEKTGDNQIILTSRGIKSDPFKIKIKEHPAPQLSGMTGGWGQDIQSIPCGMQITISGKNFGDNKAKVQVFFGEVEAPIVSRSPTQIVVTVPELPEPTWGVPISVTVDKVKSQNQLSINLQKRVW